MSVGNSAPSLPHHWHDLEAIFSVSGGVVLTLPSPQC